MTIRILLLAVLLGVSTAGCNGTEDDIQTPDPRDERLEGVEGLTAEELEREGEPLTQEEAIQRGVLDTTIYIEPLDPEDPLRPDDPFDRESRDTIPPQVP